MPPNRVSVELKKLRELLRKADTVDQLLAVTGEFLVSSFDCDEVILHCIDAQDVYTRRVSSSEPLSLPVDFVSYSEGRIVHNGRVIDAPLYIHDAERARVSPGFRKSLDRSEVLSYAVVELSRENLVSGWIELRFTNRYVSWSREERFLAEQISDYLSFYLQKLLAAEDLGEGENINREAAQFRRELDLARDQLERLTHYGRMLVIKTDPQFTITETYGDSESLLGISHKELCAGKDVWREFVYPDDLRKLARLMKRLELKPGPLNAEIRVVHKKTRVRNWLLLKAVPTYDSAGVLLGWEGFGIDISEKKSVEAKSIRQNQRIEALYEVSRALQVNLDPAIVTLKGLRALVRATKSDCGFGCFYEHGSGKLEVVASEGLSVDYLKAASEVVEGKSLVRHVVESKKGLLISNIQKDSRAATDIALKENLKSTIVMPLMSEDHVLGALVLFCRKPDRYSDDDFELVEAAASQIGLASRQAESYTNERRQADSVAVLYRLSHELSKLLTPKEVAEHAFPIIQKELACKRMWLGVMNEQGSHIIGQGGYGPGIREPIKDIQIELDLQHDFLDEAIKTKQAVLVREGVKMECSGLNRVINKLKVGDFIIVPLVSLGQVVGVFIVEPSISSRFFIQRKLPLLRSMANEIAAVILARRFEAKIADADKMRMAALLASGVAHNFNNLLQAVMGQASLIEMQLPEDSPLIGSAQTIIDAAGKGASLIKQLLSFSMQEGIDRRPVSAKQLVEDSRELYQSLLGTSVMFEIEIDESTGDVLADYSQAQQMVTNLLVNAKEAIGDNLDGMVKVTVGHTRLRSGEVDPELAPGKYIRIDIEDNGVGMDPERQARCFEPFFTTKDVDKNTGIGLSGSGLGLSSAYSIAKQHSGVITVTSNPGEGSVFSIFLPAIRRGTIGSF